MQTRAAVPDFETQVSSGERFEFGKNWQRFLTRLDETRIAEAEKSLQEMLGLQHLAGLSFLDIGSGSGLFSLAAMRLGAERVLSFDYDPNSVACGRELKRRFFPQSENWVIERGSALDDVYLQSLGKWDIVYSWGVLHHTGAMWKALKNASTPAKLGGKLFIAIYNDEGQASRNWLRIKKFYNRLPPALRFLITWPAFVRFWLPPSVKDLLTGKPFATWKNYNRTRGMSPWDDVVDWVGGYPFEVAKPEEIFDFYQKLGYTLVKLKTTNRLGNNEFVFMKG